MPQNNNNKIKSLTDKVKRLQTDVKAKIEQTKIKRVNNSRRITA